MPQAISYIRFSSAKQAHGSSLERQQSMVAQWLEQNSDYTLSGLRYQDLGRSGWKGTHLDHGFGQLLAAIENGLIQPGDSILLEAVDRAGRLEPMEMLPLLSRIVMAGVSIHTLDDGMVYTRESVNNQNLFLLVAKIQQAHQYSEALSRRLKASYTNRRTKAQEGAPIKRRTPVWLTSDGELLEDIAPFIVQAFEDYAAGLGERRILQRIRGQHPAFDNLNPSTIKRWFANTTAIGYWKDIPDVYPAVVSKELFYRVQQRIKDKYKPASAPTTYLLSGLVKCGHCGSTFSVQKHKHSPSTLSCARRARLGENGCDNNKTIPKQVLECIRIRTSLPFIEKALRGQRLSGNQKRAIEITGELEDISKKISNLSSTIAAMGLIPEIKQSLEQLQEQRQKIEQEKLILERTEEPEIDIIETMQFEKDHLVEDKIKLNSLLQSSGYSLTCYADGLILAAGDMYPWTYDGFDRKTNRYLVSNLGEQISVLKFENKYEELYYKHHLVPKILPKEGMARLMQLINRDNDLMIPDSL